MINTFNRKVAIAPMLNWTDKHYRYLARLISKNVLLYTEMVTTGALFYGKQFHLLEYNQEEHPIALQLGGSNPKELAECSRIGESFGYDEINLNIGCPSDRVQQGRFGACLMAYPELVAECVAAMQAVVSVPVTVKTRIGIDEQDSYEHLSHFINTVSQSGCKIFIIHARKAWLKGLSPKQNRDIPPLQYDKVAKLKNDFPNLTIVLNGGIKTCGEIEHHLNTYDGVMIGREAYYNPYFLSQLDNAFFNELLPAKSPFEVIEKFLEYTRNQLQKGTHLKHMGRHILTFFNQWSGAKNWRRYLSENIHRKEAGIEIILHALSYLSANVSKHQ